MTVTQGTGVARTVVTSVSVTVAEGKKETVSFELKDMKSSESKETAEVVTIPADQHGVKKDYTEFVQHLSSLTGKYTQTSGKNSGFVHMLSPFSIGKYEVTYVLWFTVYQWATSADRGPAGYTFVTSEKNTFTSDPSQDSEVKTANQPMVGVSWRDCIIWCNARSEMEGLEPVYYADSKFKEPLRSSQDQDAKDTTRKGSVDNPYVKTGSKGYRLPTSGEWQYAASCGGLYPYNHASGADVPINENSWLTPLSSENFDNDGDGTVASTEEVAWFSVNSNFVTHTVGTRAPNRWALYDMSGNVGEWTFDWEGSLPQSRQTDYSGPKSGTNRIIRGGNAFNGWLDLRISSFRQSPPYFENQFTGFRVVRSE